MVEDLTGRRLTGRAVPAPSWPGAATGPKGWPASLQNRPDLERRRPLQKLVGDGRRPGFAVALPRPGRAGAVEAGQDRLPELVWGEVRPLDDLDGGGWLAAVQADQAPPAPAGVVVDWFTRMLDGRRSDEFSVRGCAAVAGPGTLRRRRRYQYLHPH
jgi:hypothetical protein